MDSNTHKKMVPGQFPMSVGGDISSTSINTILLISHGSSSVSITSHRVNCGPFGLQFFTANEYWETKWMTNHYVKTLWHLCKLQKAGLEFFSDFLVRQWCLCLVIGSYPFQMSYACVSFFLLCRIVSFHLKILQNVCQPWPDETAELASK